jgi:hypothetical protein
MPAKGKTLATTLTPIPERQHAATTAKTMIASAVMHAFIGGTPPKGSRVFVEIHGISLKRRK